MDHVNIENEDESKNNWHLKEILPESFNLSFEEYICTDESYKLVEI